MHKHLSHISMAQVLRNLLKRKTMKTQEPKMHSNFFEAFSSKVTQVTGSTPAFMIALFAIIAWGITGPFFHYSEN